MEMRAFVVRWSGWIRSSDVSIMLITSVLRVNEKWKEINHALIISTFAKAQST